VSNGLVPALKQVAGPAVPFVEELRIHSVQLAHAYGQVAVRGFDKKMIMVGHNAVGVTNPVVSFVDVLDGVQKFSRLGSSLKTGFFSLSRDVT